MVSIRVRVFTLLTVTTLWGSVDNRQKKLIVPKTHYSARKSSELLASEHQVNGINSIRFA